MGGAQALRLDEIARAIDTRTAAEVWQRFRAGERGVLGRHLYSVDGQTTFDEISRRYDGDGEFRATVDRYMGDFERLLGEAEHADPQGRMMQNYLTSETGRARLLLAHERMRADTFSGNDLSAGTPPFGRRTARCLARGYRLRLNRFTRLTLFEHDFSETRFPLF